jgi:superfamily II DNA/RNA helicase
MHTFHAFTLPRSLNESLAQLNFINPTPIQEAAIPYILEGKDVLGTAQTGTGKTGAFGIPLIAKLITNTQSAALVMTPTRELAMQVMKTLKLFIGQHKTIDTALLIGGASLAKQYIELRRKPRLIVGTPGRINDHLQQKTLSLRSVDFLVLDETDRMLDMGFGVQIDRILTYMPQERQTLLFSATMPENILKLSKKYLTTPERISVGSTTTPIASVEQENILLADSEKYDQLLEQLHKREGSIIVFVKTKFGAERMAKKLRTLKHEANAIHGGLRQNQRDKAISAFRNKNCRIMVATDIAARGLDIPHIEHVINYDLPQCPEDYIHRIGRTGRAGATGFAANLITPQDKKNWNAICRLIEPHAQQKEEDRSPKKTQERRRPRRRYANRNTSRSSAHPM